VRASTREDAAVRSKKASSGSPPTPDPSQHGGGERPSQRGFVLLVVLSVLGLLAVVAASFAQVARTHMKLAAVASEGAKAEALADAGVHIVILDLMAAGGAESAGRRFALDGSPLACGIGDEGAALTLAVRDEAGKVDLNIATPALLRTLVLGLGLSGREAAVDAILDYRDQDDDRRINGAERPEYLAAGRPHGPRNGPFLAVEELSSVLGVTQADADRLRPYVTIYSGLPAIDPGVASEALIEVLARGLQDAGPSLGDSGLEAGDLAGMGERGARLPPQLRAASTRRAFAVRAEARTALGAVFVREAIVEFVAPGSPAFALRRWYRGAAASPGPSPAARDLPRC
jgi:general secretion pathway protein K